MTKWFLKIKLNLSPVNSKVSNQINYAADNGKGERKLISWPSGDTCKISRKAALIRDLTESAQSRPVRHRGSTTASAFQRKSCFERKNYYKYLAF